MLALFHVHVAEAEPLDGCSCLAWAALLMLAAHVVFVVLLLGTGALPSNGGAPSEVAWFTP
jgi:hypothetical protein